jgi:hypothetical protein
MPTASTAQILGNNESTEPFTSNMYNRRVLAGEFPVVNKYVHCHLEQILATRTRVCRRTSELAGLYCRRMCGRVCYPVTTPSHTHSLTYSLTHSLTPSPPHPLIN